MVGSLHPSAIDLMARKVAAGLITEGEALAQLGFPTLDALAERYGTDKGPSDHNYTPLYEKYLGRHRDEPLTLLEMGVWQGASLRMWREYFPNATIVGIDNKDRNIHILGVEMLFSDQDNPHLVKAMSDLDPPPSVIIDDASHVSSKTIRTFQNLFPILQPGGIYVIEDLQTSYDETHYGLSEASFDPERSWRGNPTAMQFCKRLADEVNSSLFPERHRLGFDVASVQFFPNICFITKAGKWSAK